MRIGIIGAAGRMGWRRAQDLLQLPDTELWVYDVHDRASAGGEGRPGLLDLYGPLQQQGNRVHIASSNVEVAQNVELLEFETPVPRTDVALKEVAQHIPEGTIVVTNSSAKEIVAKLETELIPPGRDLVDIHTMYSESLSPTGQVALTVPIRTTPSGLYVVQQLGSRVGHRLVHNIAEGPTVHDEIMAEVQGGTHLESVEKPLAWMLIGTTPDRHPVYQNPLDRIKAQMSLRVLGQNLEVYVVTLLWNLHTRGYVDDHIGISRALRHLRDSGQREQLYGIVEGIRAYLDVRGELKEAREILAEALEQKILLGDQNSYWSQIVTGEQWRRKNIRPTDNAVYESGPYKLRRLLTYAVFAEEPQRLRRMVDNAIDNPVTNEDDNKYTRAAEIIGRYIRRGVPGTANLLTLFRNIKSWYETQGYDFKKVVAETNGIIQRINALTKA